MYPQVYQTCLELIEQRGYNIVQAEDECISAVKPDGETFYVFTQSVPQFNIEALFQCTSNMVGRTSHALVIYSQKATSKAVQTVEYMAQTPITYKGTAYPAMKIELFAEEDLKYNITKHRLQPQFERLDEDEATVFKKKWGKYGTMKITDPVARFYNYQRGDVIRITRKNKIIYYRIVR